MRTVGHYQGNDGCRYPIFGTDRDAPGAPGWTGSYPYSPLVYLAACSSCWLHHAHTEDAHRAAGGEVIGPHAPDACPAGARGCYLCRRPSP